MRKLLILFSFFIFHFSLFAQSWLWGQYGKGNNWVDGVKATPHGDCYVSGLFPGTNLQFGSYLLKNKNVTYPPYCYDPFLVKYDARGNVLWATQWYCSDTSRQHFTSSPASTTIDYKGNVYLNGNFTDTLIVGTYTTVSNYSQSQGNTCVAKYDSNGNVKWIKYSTNSHGDDTTMAVGQSLTSDLFGDVYLLGIASYDTVSFGNIKLHYKYDMYFNDFLVKYDSGGVIKWAKQATPINRNSASISYAVTNDLQGNVYTTGGFYDSVKYGTFVLGNNLTVDYDLIKWDSAGNVLWIARSKAVNSNSNCEGQSVVTDAHDNVYVCGDYSYDVIIGTDTLKGGIINNTYRFFVAKYNSNGSLIWIKQSNVLDSNSWQAYSISCDNKANLYISGNGGHGRCELAFGGDTLSLNDTARYDGASFVFKLDSNGNALCGAIIPGGANFWNSITSDSSGKYVYLGGTIETPVVFGKDTVNPFSYPPFHFLGYTARWEACDSSLLLHVTEEQKPISNAQVVVYPNPSNGFFNILMEQAAPAKIEVYDIFGQEIYSGSFNSRNTQINIEGNPAGVYFYRVITQIGSLLGEGKIVIE